MKNLEHGDFREGSSSKSAQVLTLLDVLKEKFGGIMLALFLYLGKKLFT